MSNKPPVEWDVNFNFSKYLEDNNSKRISKQMEQIHEDLENEKVVPITPQLKLLTGGKDGGTGCWLIDKVEAGEHFLTRPKQANVNVNSFELMRLVKIDITDGGAAVLGMLDAGGNIQPLFVDARRFCLKHDLFEVLDKNKEADNAPSNRTDQ